MEFIDCIFIAQKMLNNLIDRSHNSELQQYLAAEDQIESGSESQLLIGRLFLTFDLTLYL